MLKLHGVNFWVLSPHPPRHPHRQIGPLEARETLEMSFG